MLYGCETWTLTQGTKQRVKAAEMWFLRRMLRIPWTSKITNERILQMTQCSRALLPRVREQQLKFLGHLLRHNTLEKDILL